jgi:PAS domain S-box-containing protein
MNRILIVDDKEENLYYLRTLLTGHGYAVESAVHGAEALVKARQQPPDLIVSDLLMPVMDGYTLLRHWKADERLKKIPFIVYTATYTEEEDEQLALSLGADAFILKPAEPEDFLARIREVQANAAGAVPRVPHRPVGDEKELFKVYSETLIRKLEEKTMQLEEANRALQQDIAERRRTEEAWRESENRLRAIFETEPECVKVVSAEGGLLEMNRAGLAMLEAGSVEEVQRKSLAAFIAPEYRDAFRELHRRVMAGGNERLEFEIVGQHGTRRRLDTHATPLRGPGGEVTALLAVTRDITEQTLANAKLRTSEAGLAAAQALVHLGSWELDLATMTGTYSAEMSRLFYRDPALGAPTFAEFLELIHPADRPTIEQAVARTAEAHEPFTLEYRTHPSLGPVRHLSATVVVIRDAAGQPVRTAGTALDITARKQAEEQLKLLETCVARFEDIVIITEAEPIDEPGPRIVFVNDAFVRRTGYTREEALGRSPRFLQGPKTSRAELDRIKGALRQWKPVRAELINYTKSGQEFWLELDLVPVADPTGWFTHWVAVERDVTERKRLEDRLHRLIESNIQGVFFWQADGTISGANDAFLRMTGYSREDLAAGRMNFYAMTPPEFAAVDQRAVAQLVAAQVCNAYEKEYLRRDGTRVPVLLGAASYADNPEEGVAFVLDITERKQLEQQVLRAQRMESIGTLAGGVAHDLNNALGPIIMSLDLLQMRFPDPESQELISVIASSAQRGAEMVRQVLSFARGVGGQRTEVEIKHLIRDIEKIATDTFLKNITVRTIVPPDLWTVLGDPTQLHQVLLNLCVNARDAMPDGGTLIISAENRLLDEHYAGLNPESRPGPHVFLQVEDTGTGMPPEIIEKIFDPFFTTKEVGKGTGLGLSTSMAIVKSHGGFLRVYSEVGKGTKFKVYLPGQTEKSETAIVAAAAEMPRGNGELILVADDEASVRQITQQTLEAFGYRAILACDGAEAVAHYARRGAEIAVVLTDMMMPVMDGPATIRVLRKLNPSLPIIAASGLSANSHVAQAASLGVKHFLPKPYTAETLLKALKQELAAEG